MIVSAGLRRQPIEEVATMTHSFSQRELIELSDQLLTHEALIEKAGFLATQAQSPELQQMIRRHQQTYLRHYNDMVAMIQRAKPVPFSQGGFGQ